jgi:hypothetical protein
LKPRVTVTERKAGPVKQEIRGSSRAKGPTDEDLRWWLAPSEDLWQRVVQVADRIEDNSSGRRRQNYAHHLMYSDVDPFTVYATMGENFDRTGDFGSGSRITLNVVQNAVDSAASMIAKNKPKPMFLTDGADYHTFLKAGKLTKYVGAVIEDADVYNIAERVFTDAAVYGTGALRFFLDKEEGRVRCEWVYINEILVDDIEGQREKPCQIHQKKFVSRDVLCTMFPKHETAIRAVEMPSALAANRGVADVIPCYESWHLKSGAKAKDGRHSICVNGVTLFDEEYDKDYYPILFWRMYHAPMGFWGRGICHSIGRIQRTINKLLRTIDIAQDLVAAPVYFVPKTAMVQWDHLLANDIGRAVEYLGEQPPTCVPQQAMANEVYQHVWALEQRAYNIVGVNQNMAQGQKQPGVESAVGQREATDIATGRFQVVSQRWEQWFTEIAHVIVDMSKDLGDEAELNVEDRGSLTRVKWADVDLERDRFKIAVYQFSGLPSTPTGRIETLQSFKDMGLVDNEWFMTLLDLPDLRQMTDLETSTKALAMASLAKIKETGDYKAEWSPTDKMNLPEAFSVAAKTYVDAKLKGLPQDTLDLIDQYCQDVQYLIQKQAPPAPPPPAVPPGGMPQDMGQGAPPPDGSAPPPGAPPPAPPGPPPPQ